MKKLPKKTGNRKLKPSFLKTVFLIFPFVIILYLITRGLLYTTFFQKKDRINVIFSAEKISYYSIGLTDKVNYFISFFPDLDVTVPGGYGFYRMGALPKLASLEKKPDLIKKAYSAATSSMVDFYFYPSSSSDRMEIFFGKENKNFSLPKMTLLFFGQSNANLFDRFFLYLQFLGKTKGQFKDINSLKIKNQGSRIVFLPNDFYESAQGIFYRKTYRTELRSVQIVYTRNYNTALQLAQIMEGEGIRVVDLSQSEQAVKKCEVIENNKIFSETAKSISNFFACRLLTDKTEAYDIILRLGETEKEWSVE